MINRTELSQIKERESKATAGPWTPYFVFGSSALPTCIESDKKDSEGKNIEICAVEEWYTEENNPTPNFRFIAHSRSDVPALVATLERAIKIIEDLRVYDESMGGMFHMEDAVQFIQDFYAI